MGLDFERLLQGDFSGNEGAGADEIARLEKAIGRSLPPDFKEFLLATNGGEGMVGDTYLAIWSAEEIAEYDKSYEVQEYAPGLLLFGSNGGGEAFGWDTRRNPWGVIMVPFVGMSLKDAKPLAANFGAFLTELASRGKS